MKPRGRWVRALLMLAVLAAGADALWISTHWPDWKRLARGSAPRSRFIRDWERENRSTAAWQPVPLAAIPDVVQHAVIAAEDASFWEHEGFDVEALQEAITRDVKRHRIAFGGSTISQQTAKNLFLTPSRNPLRKWHEAVLTWGMERHLEKRRILEIYLNDAELGDGVFGVEAAARAYWKSHARELGPEQAIELAASLPSPRHDNPATRTKSFLARMERIRGWLAEAGALVNGSAGSPAPGGGPESGAAR